MSVLGKRIISLRKRDKILQNEFAKKLAVSNVVLSRYESGERKPDYETLQKIADFFDVTVDYLLGRSNNPDAHKIAIAAQETTMSIKTFELFEEFRKHPELLTYLSTNPELKVKELIKFYKIKKMLLEDEPCR